MSDTDYTSWTGFQPGCVWVHKSRPAIHMGVVRVEGDRVVCQRVGLRYDEGNCAPYPIPAFLDRYELSAESSVGASPPDEGQP